MTQEVNKTFKNAYEKMEGANIKEKISRISYEMKELCHRQMEAGRREKKKPWMTDEIMELMETRRLCKGQVAEYREVNKQIKRKIRKAKEEWMNQKCRELEEIEKKNDALKVHQKVKEIAGLRRGKIPAKLFSENGKLAVDITDKQTVWIKYVEKMFHDIRREAETVTLVEEERLEFLKSEVANAVKVAKPRKAMGPDELPSEVIKLLDEDSIQKLTKLFNEIYATGEIPNEWLLSTFITLPKKPTASKCDEYRMISLMSHLLKTFIRIIHSRIQSACEDSLDESQFGFRKGFGTREALFMINVLFQKCRDQRRDVYVCFLDYEKAFDRVKHDDMMRILKERNVNAFDRRIVENLYWKQRAAIRVEGQETETVNICRGVRQGCILSPTLFNIYADDIIKKALHDAESGIRVNGKNINNIRYADDTVLFADSMEDLKNLVDKLNNEGQKYRLEINVAKTKLMIISRNEYPEAQLIINGKHVERVQEFKYLGAYISDQLEPLVEVKRRIGYAKTTFGKMKNYLTNGAINMKRRQKMLKCYIHSVLLYGAEATTYTAQTIKRIEACEMWFYRRMLKIPWIKKVTNAEVLKRAGTERTILETIKKRKINYFETIMKEPKYELLRLVMQGKIEGRRGRGRGKISWLNNVRKWT
jgi:hypothetical protein